MTSKKQDLKYQADALRKVINGRYKMDSSGSIFIFVLLIIAFSLIIGGGILENLYAIGSGTILLIFLFFSLR